MLHVAEDDRRVEHGHTIFIPNNHNKRFTHRVSWDKIVKGQGICTKMCRDDWLEDS